MTRCINRGGNRIGRLLLALVLACSFLALQACATTSSDAQSETTTETTADSTTSEASAESGEASEDVAIDTTVSMVDGGNVTLAVSSSELLESYYYGDVVAVSINGQTVDVPVVSSYNDVDAGVSALIVRESKGACRLLTYMGNFATTYDAKEGDAVHIALKEAGAYLKDLEMRNLKYTDEREDYPNLTDAEFANFRVVETTGMGEGVIYRSATPVNPKHNRNTYADAAMAEAGIAGVMDLSDSEEELLAFEGYDDTYYATVDHIALDLGYDFTSAENKEGLARGLRHLTQTQGGYLIHCLEGKDRTGFVVALLEILAGANLDEVIADYMVTFTNYYGVGTDDARYDYTAQHGIVLSLERAFGVEDLASVDLLAETEGYLRDCGLSDDEIAALKARLAGNAAAAEATDEELVAAA